MCCVWVKFVVVVSYIIFVGCGGKSDNISTSSALVEDVSYSFEVTHSIVALKSLYIDDSHSIAESVVISGIITANDVMGEFPNTLVIEDSSGAIELSVDDLDLEAYAIGRELVLVCSDLWIASRGGTLLLGLESTDVDNLVDQIDEAEFLRRSQYSTTTIVVEPRSVDISDIDTSLISCYVRLDGVTFITDGEEVRYCERDSESGQYLSTSHTIEDESGDQLEVYVYRRAIYCNDILPSGSGSICGILDKYGSKYSLRIVNYRVYFDI